MREEKQKTRGKKRVYIYTLFSNAKGNNFELEQNVRNKSGDNIYMYKYLQLQQLIRSTSAHISIISKNLTDPYFDPLFCTIQQALQIIIDIKTIRC